MTLSHAFMAEVDDNHIDPILCDNYDDSEVCVEDLSVSGKSKEYDETSTGRSTDCSVSSNKSQLSVPKVDFVGKFGTVDIKPNDMIKSYRTKFVKTGDDVKNKCVLN
ncbi:hypothetical protein R6Q57_011481 [Mikania cordata]